MPKAERRRLWPVLSAVLLVAACGELWDNVPPRPAATDDPAVDATAYPSLSSVPQRPQLTYTLEQKREIAEGLVADRANARHRGDEGRRELGRPTAPVEPIRLPPPPAQATSASGESSPRGTLALAYVEEALARDADDGSLNDFLERLQQPPPPAPGGRSRTAAGSGAEVDTAPEAAVPATSAPVSTTATIEKAAPDTAAPDVVAPDAAAPAAGAASAVPSTAGAAPASSVTTPAVAAANQPAAAIAPPDLPLVILFEADTAEIDERQVAKLGAFGRSTRGGGPSLLINGGGTSPALAMERARRVAAALLGAGVTRDRLVIEMGGESPVVVVYEPDGDAG